MHDNRMYTQVPLEKMPVAMAYVPWTHWEELYDLNKGYNCGTIFPSLNKPFGENMLCRGGAR